MTTQIINLNTVSIKKAIKMYCGVSALVRKGNAGKISVFVKTGAEDISKVEKFFSEFNIKCLAAGNQIMKPFHVNGGEFNSLIAIEY